MMPVYDRRVEQEVSKRFIKVSVGISVFLVVAFIQAVSWDQFFFEVIPLQVKSLVGGLSAQDADRFAEICKIRKNLDCVESALANKFAQTPSQIETLAVLGKIQMQRGKFRESANTLGNYFRSGGLSVDASYDYAKSLSEVGMVDQASQYYQRVLASRPDVMQVTVTQNFVKMLMSHNRYQEAKNLIEGVRAKGGNASMFMENEMSQIEKITQ